MHVLSLAVQGWLCCAVIRQYVHAAAVHRKGYDSLAGQIPTAESAMILFGRALVPLNILYTRFCIHFDALILQGTLQGRLA